MTLRLQQEREILRYRVSSLTLACDVPFPELQAVSTQALHADLQVRLLTPGEPCPVPSHWFMSWRSPTGECCLSAARVPAGYFLRFHDVADFTMDNAGRQITCVESFGSSGETLRHLLLDQVLPLALTLRGYHALHATAVLTPAGICAFIGPTGSGKSTLAASFLLAGFMVISDDCLVLEKDDGRILARPAYPGVRLREDTLDALCIDQCMTLPVADYSSKRRPGQGKLEGRFPAERCPLARIYTLARHPQLDGRGLMPRIEPLSTQEAFLTTLSCTFTLETEDMAFLQRQFDWVGQVVDKVPVARLHVPDRFTSLAAVRETILSALATP